MCVVRLLLLPWRAGRDQHLDVEREGVGRDMVDEGPVGSCFSLSHSDQLPHQQLWETWVCSGGVNHTTNRSDILHNNIPSIIELILVTLLNIATTLHHISLLLILCIYLTAAATRSAMLPSVMCPSMYFIRRRWWRQMDSL